VSDLEQVRRAVSVLMLMDWLPESDDDVIEAAETILAAARELLALKENGQTVEWCELHKSQRFDEESCWLRNTVDAWLGPSCRFVVGTLHIHREGT
jgi:hypothetical protein